MCRGCQDPVPHQERPAQRGPRRSNTGRQGPGPQQGLPGRLGKSCRSCASWFSETHPQEMLAAGCIKAETSTHLGQRAGGKRSPGMVQGKPDGSADAKARACPPGSKPHTRSRSRWGQARRAAGREQLACFGALGAGSSAGEHRVSGQLTESEPRSAGAAQQHLLVFGLVVRLIWAESRAMQVSP